MKCDVCSILENKKDFKIVYEDEKCFVILHESPVSLGHCLVIPKKHIPIVEETEDDIVGHLFFVANTISNIIFQVTGAHGTNILINNGHAAGQELPHIIVNVIPRKEGDALNFEWKQNKASESELKTTQSMLKLYSEPIFSGRDKMTEIKLKDNADYQGNHDPHDIHHDTHHTNTHKDTSNETSSEKKSGVYGKAQDDYTTKVFRRIP